MRHVFRFCFALALGLALLAGCSDENGEAGSGGTAGTGGNTGQVFPCTEQGIREAVELGGGPHRFTCDGPTTLRIEATIVIDNDVILDGEGKLTVDLGRRGESVVSIEDASAQIRGFRVTGAGSEGPAILSSGVAVSSRGELRLTGSSVFDNAGAGVYSRGGNVIVEKSTVSNNMINIVSSVPSVLIVADSTISEGVMGDDNLPAGVWSCGSLLIINSTVSQNEGIGISHRCNANAHLTNVSVSGNHGPGVVVEDAATMEVSGTIIKGECVTQAEAVMSSLDHNIESPGDTCGFDDETDQVNVSAEALRLGLLQDNGGPTMTHALGAGSVAIDQIPAEDCVDADGEPLTADQRGEPRPETGGTMCDVGAFELQP